MHVQLGSHIPTLKLSLLRRPIDATPRHASHCIALRFPQRIRHGSDAQSCEVFRCSQPIQSLAQVSFRSPTSLNLRPSIVLAGALRNRSIARPFSSIRASWPALCSFRFTARVSALPCLWMRFDWSSESALVSPMHLELVAFSRSGSHDLQDATKVDNWLG